MDNTHFSQWIAPGQIGKSAGTWVPTLASNVASEVLGQADASFTLLVPISLLQNSAYRAGAKLKSIDVYYAIATAADDFATVELEKMTLGADDTAITGASVDVTLDSGHDTATKRKAADTDHVMTVTLDAAEWMDNDAVFVLAMVVDAAATTDFTLFGARANFELRA